MGIKLEHKFLIDVQDLLGFEWLNIRTVSKAAFKVVVVHREHRCSLLPLQSGL